MFWSLTAFNEACRIHGTLMTPQSIWLMPGLGSTDLVSLGDGQSRRGLLHVDTMFSNHVYRFASSLFQSFCAIETWSHRHLIEGFIWERKILYVCKDPCTVLVRMKITAIASTSDHSGHIIFMKLKLPFLRTSEGKAFACLSCLHLGSVSDILHAQCFLGEQSFVLSSGMLKCLEL